MKRTLKNALNESFESKIIGNSDIKDQMFLWKHNIKIISVKKNKGEKEIHKNDSKKSKSSKLNYDFWLSGQFSLTKSNIKWKNKFEQSFIHKGLLTISATGDIPEKKISSVEAKEAIDELSFFFTSSMKKIQTKQEDLFLKYQSNKNELKNFKHFSKKIIKNFNEKARELFLKIKKIYPCNLETININKEKLSSASKDIKEFYAKNKNGIIKSFKSDMKEFSKFNNLSIYDKFRLFAPLNSYRYHKSQKMVKVYKKYSDLSFDNKFKFEKALCYEKHGKLIMDNKMGYAKKLNDLIGERKKIGKEKQAQLLQAKNEINYLKVKTKKIWAEKLRSLKASSASKRAKAIEKKKIYSNYLVEKINIKLDVLKVKQMKNKVSILRNKMKNDIKYQNKLRENDLRDINIKTPVEITKSRYWLSVSLGVLFPGLGAILLKKYVKGILQIIATIFVVLILAWVLGAFPSAKGDGIAGLVNLGHDSATQTDITIGTTGGVPNDGRFFLVMGALGIIMLAFVIMYWMISILDNINQNNLARLGVRSSRWKDQKQLIKSSGLPYLLSAPAIIFILFIVVLPLISTIMISFTNFGQRYWDTTDKKWLVANGTTNPISWVAWDQFKMIFKVMGPEFKDVLIWTLIWTFGATFTLIIIGTFFAVIVNQNRIKFKTLFRVVYILPWAVPAFISIMFFSLFFKHDGIFNGLFGLDTDWASAGNKTKMLMIFMQGWLGHSYIFLLVTGMLQSIPKSLYEAARIDGSPPMRQFSTITAPIIIGQIAPLLIGQFTFNFNNFGLIYLFNQGGTIQAGRTAGEQDIFISWIYKLINSGNDNRPGAAAAMSLIISVFTVTPSAFLFLKSKSFKKGL